jgi:phosphoglycerate dehydrogenase-like enzyme
VIRTRRLLVRCSGTDLPDWVIEQGERLGVVLTAPRTDDVLAPDVIAEELVELGADGYLMNGPGPGSRRTMPAERTGRDPGQVTVRKPPGYGPYVSGELLDAAGGLRLVSYLGQSTEPAAYASFADLGALRERGIPFTHAPAVPSSVAEGAMALLLALNLGVSPANATRKAGEPSADRTRHGLRGSTLGIVGMGQIGRQVAELATAFGMRVQYFSRTRRPDIEVALGARYTELPELFATAGSVSLHTPPGASEGLITKELLAHADGIDLIDTTSIARVVEPAALLCALERGWVARAAIEGAYPEPYDERIRAFGDDRVLLLPPYTSWNTEQDRRAGWVAYLETLSALLDNRPLPYRLV